MATITINIKDNIEKEFRVTVKKKLGVGKGILGKAIEEAIKNWLEEEKQKKITEREINLVENGLYIIKDWKFNREEIYERK